VPWKCPEAADEQRFGPDRLEPVAAFAEHDTAWECFHHFTKF